MAELKQFFRGETIKIQAVPASGESLTNGVMLVYPDDLDLTNSANKSKITKIENPTSQQGGAYEFTIPAATSLSMKAGSYTVELYYGNVTIVRSNRVFVLVDSGYALQQSRTETNGSISGDNNSGDNTGENNDGRV